MHAIDIDTLLRTPKPPMLCEGLIPSTGIMLIAGAPGVGKTWYSLECALALTSRVSAFGRYSALPSRVLYIGQDSPQWDVSAMVGKLLRGHGLDKSEVNGMCFAIHQGASLDDTRGAMELVGLIDQYLSTWWQDEDQELVQDEPRGLVIVDNLRKMHSKREANSDDMVGIMDKLRLLAKSVCVMVLHHPSKPGEFEKENWAEIRGSGEIVGGSDCAVFLKQSRGLTHASVIRARAAKPLDFSYRLIDEDDVVRLEAEEEKSEVLESAMQWCRENVKITRADVVSMIEKESPKSNPETVRRHASRVMQVLMSKGFTKKLGYNNYKSLKYKEMEGEGDNV